MHSSADLVIISTIRTVLIRTKFSTEYPQKKYRIYTGLVDKSSVQQAKILQGQLFLFRQLEERRWEIFLPKLQSSLYFAFNLRDTKTVNKLNARRIIMARESRGINQSELATSLGITAGYMSKIEQGDTPVSDENVSRISTITNYPKSFFYQEGDIIAENLSFRKRETVAQKLVTPITAKANIIRLQVQYLTEQLSITPPTLPAIDVTEESTPAQIAKEVRKRWRLRSPAVDNVTQTLEEHGIAISSFPFITERVDSRCMLTENRQPIIFLNSQMLGDRQRFSLAFELGHLVMHTFVPVPLERSINHEANQFAAEFLMPEDEIRKDFKKDVTVALLGELKRKWKVSMIALLYRADDLGFVTPNQKRYILQQFNQLQIRRREPVELDVPVEKPELLRRWVADLKDKQKLSTAQTAELLHTSTDEFIELYS